jgi:hypothetical protein
MMNAEVRSKEEGGKYKGQRGKDASALKLQSLLYPAL